MTYKTKKTIIEMLTGAAVAIAYIIYSAKSAAPTDDIAAWAKSMLIFIGIGVGVLIITQIIFHIALAVGNEVKAEMNGKKAQPITQDMIEDEMDERIELKAGRVGYTFTGLGIVAALFALVFGAAMLTALHILFGALCLASLAEGISKLCYYERGVS